VVAPRIMSSGTQYCSAIESNTTRPIERFGDIVAYPMLGGYTIDTHESRFRKRQ
jgi:hypothetical protein